MNKFLLVIFFLNVVLHLVQKNWTGAMGWVCAFIWLALYEFRPTKRAGDGAESGAN